jgi:hypothetical protein
MKRKLNSVLSSFLEGEFYGVEWFCKCPVELCWTLSTEADLYLVASMTSLETDQLQQSGDTHCTDRLAYEVSIERVTGSITTVATHLQNNMKSIFCKLRMYIAPMSMQTCDDTLFLNERIPVKTLYPYYNVWLLHYFPPSLNSELCNENLIAH